MRDPEELADENLRKLCAVTGAEHHKDHWMLSPMGNPTYPGPWVRVKVGEVTYTICVQYAIMEKAGISFGTCYYIFPVTGETQFIPHAEVVASALFLVKNDPNMFEKWSLQDGPYA